MQLSSIIVRSIPVFVKDTRSPVVSRAKEQERDEHDEVRMNVCRLEEGNVLHMNIYGPRTIKSWNGALLAIQPFSQVTRERVMCVDDA